MDITLHIIISPAKHELPPDKAAMRYRKGDVIDVYLADKYSQLQGDGSYICSNPRMFGKFAMVHITGIPDHVFIEVIKRKLTGEVFYGTDIDNLKMSRRRKWHIPPSMLPSGFKNKILSDKQVTVSWAIVKNYIRRKVTNDTLNPDSDDITTVLKDQDIGI